MTDTIINELVALKDKFMSIESELYSQLRDVEAKSKNFTDLDKEVNDKILANNTHVRLNIGGKIFITKLSILLSDKTSVFFNLFIKYMKNKQQFPTELFFDRNYTYFNVVLDYFRYKNVNLKNYKKDEVEEIKEELEYYGIDLFKRRGAKEIAIEWDPIKSKSGACTVDDENPRNLKVHSITCYTHFMTDREFLETDEDFVIEFESRVVQSDYYYYIGLMNEQYSLTGNCGCCNPGNAFYIKCDGTIHISGTSTSSNLAWNSQECIIGMKVLFSQKQIYFYKDDPDNIVGPYSFSGTKFWVYAGHCNTGNGNLSIKTCYYLNK